MSSPLLLCLVFATPMAGDPVVDGQTLTAWVKQLSSTDPAQRGKAINALRQLGAKAAPATPALIKIVQSPNDGYRTYAVELLGSIGPGAKAATPALVECCKDPSGSLAYQAARAIARIDPESAEFKTAALLVLKHTQPRLGCSMLDEVFLIDHVKLVAPLLPDWLAHPEPLVRERTAKAIHMLAQQRGQEPRLIAQLPGKLAGQISTSLLNALGDADISVRLAVLEALFSIDAKQAAKPALPHVVDLLTRMRLQSYQAARYLIGIEAEAVPLLIQALDNADEGQQKSVGQTLAALGAKAVPALMEALAAAAPRTRVGAARALAWLGAPGKAALPSLRKALDDEREELRLAAAIAIYVIDRTEAAATVPALVSVLKSGDERQRRETAEHLTLMGPAGAKAAPALLEMLAKESKLKLRVQAAVAVAAVAPERGGPAVPVLMAGVAATDDPMQRPSIKALGQLGALAKEAVPALLAALETKNPHARLAAAEAVIRIEPAHTDAGVAAISGLLKDKKHRNSMVGLYCVEALVRLGPASKGALPTLLEHLGAKGDDQGPWRPEIAEALVRLDEGKFRIQAFDHLRLWLDWMDGESRYDALEAIERLGPLAAPLTPTLIGLLQHKLPNIRAETARALGAIGPDAKAAIPALRLVAMDSRPSVRDAALQAIKQIEPQQH